MRSRKHLISSTVAQSSYFLAEPQRGGVLLSVNYLYCSMNNSLLVMILAAVVVHRIHCVSTSIHEMKPETITHFHQAKNKIWICSTVHRTPRHIAHNWTRRPQTCWFVCRLALSWKCAQISVYQSPSPFLKYKWCVSNFFRALSNGSSDNRNTSCWLQIWKVSGAGTESSGTALIQQSVLEGLPAVWHLHCVVV